MAGDTPAPAPSATLHAVSKHIALRCAGVNAAFMECKRSDPDPAACVKPGTAVTGCVVDLCVAPQTPLALRKSSTVSADRELTRRRRRAQATRRGRQGWPAAGRLQRVLGLP